MVPKDNIDKDLEKAEEEALKNGSDQENQSEADSQGSEESGAEDQQNGPELPEGVADDDEKSTDPEGVAEDIGSQADEAVSEESPERVEVTASEESPEVQVVEEKSEIYDDQTDPEVTVRVTLECTVQRSSFGNVAGDMRSTLLNHAKPLWRDQVGSLGLDQVEFEDC